MIPRKFSANAHHHERAQVSSPPAAFSQVLHAINLFICIMIAALCGCWKDSSLSSMSSQSHDSDGIFFESRQHRDSSLIYFAEGAYSSARGERYDNESYILLTVRSVNRKDFLGGNQQSWPFLNLLCRNNTYLTSWHPVRQSRHYELEELGERRSIILGPENINFRTGSSAGGVSSLAANAKATTATPQPLFMRAFYEKGMEDTNTSLATTTSEATTTSSSPTTTTPTPTTTIATTTQVVTTTSVRPTTTATTTPMASTSPAPTVPDTTEPHVIPPLYTEQCSIYNTAYNSLGVFKPLFKAVGGYAGYPGYEYRSSASSSGGGGGGASGSSSPTASPASGNQTTAPPTTTTTPSPNGGGTVPIYTIEALRKMPHIAVRVSSSRQPVILSPDQQNFFVTVFVRGTEEARNRLVDYWNGVGPDSDLNQFYTKDLGIMSARILLEPAQLWGAFDDPADWPPRPQSDYAEGGGASAANGQFISDVFWSTTYTDIMDGEGLSLGWTIIIIMGMVLTMSVGVIMYHRRVGKKEVGAEALQGREEKKKRRRKNSILKLNIGSYDGSQQGAAEGLLSQQEEADDEDDDDEDDYDEAAFVLADRGGEEGDHHEHFTFDTESEVPEGWRVEDLRKELRKGMKEHKKALEIASAMEKRREKDELWKKPYQGAEEPILNHQLHRMKRNKMNENAYLFDGLHGGASFASAPIALDRAGEGQKWLHEENGGDEEMEQFWPGYYDEEGNYQYYQGMEPGTEGYARWQARQQQAATNKNEQNNDSFARSSRGDSSPQSSPNDGRRHHTKFENGHRLVEEEEFIQPNPYQWTLQPLMETMKIDESFRLPPKRNPDGSIIPRRARRRQADGSAELFGEGGDMYDDDDDWDYFEATNKSAKKKGKKGKNGGGAATGGQGEDDKETKKKKALQKAMRKGRFGGIAFDGLLGGDGGGEDEDDEEGEEDDEFNFELPPDEGDENPLNPNASARKKALTDEEIRKQRDKDFFDTQFSKIGLAARRRMNEMRDVQRQVINATLLSNQGVVPKRENYAAFSNKTAFDRVAFSKFAFAAGIFPNWNESEEEQRRRLESMGLDVDGNPLQPSHAQAQQQHEGGEEWWGGGAAQHTADPPLAGDADHFVGISGAADDYHHSGSSFQTEAMGNPAGGGSSSSNHNHAKAAALLLSPDGGNTFDNDDLLPNFDGDGGGESIAEQLLLESGGGSRQQKQQQQPIAVVPKNPKPLAVAVPPASKEEAMNNNAQQETASSPPAPLSTSDGPSTIGNDPPANSRPQQQQQAAQRRAMSMVGKAPPLLAPQASPPPPPVAAEANGVSESHLAAGGEEDSAPKPLVRKTSLSGNPRPPPAAALAAAAARNAAASKQQSEQQAPPPPPTAASSVKAPPAAAIPKSLPPPPAAVTANAPSSGPRRPSAASIAHRKTMPPSAGSVPSLPLSDGPAATTAEAVAGTASFAQGVDIDDL